MTSPAYDHLTPPATGELITMHAGKLRVPDQPVIPFIEGDGTGLDIRRASQRVFDAAVAKAYGGKLRIVWFEVLAGEKAKDKSFATIAGQVVVWPGMVIESPWLAVM